MDNLEKKEICDQWFKKIDALKCFEKNEKQDKIYLKNLVLNIISSKNIFNHKLAHYENIKKNSKLDLEVEENADIKLMYEFCLYIKKELYNE